MDLRRFTVLLGGIEGPGQEPLALFVQVNQAPGRGIRGTVIGIGARDRGKPGQDRHSVRD